VSPEQAIDEALLEQIVRERGIAAGCREAARRALRLAHRYREEEGREGERERACIAQARAWLRRARVGPGLARAAALDLPEARATEAHKAAR
jgi:hypothetical protein